MLYSFQCSNSKVLYSFQCSNSKVLYSLQCSGSEVLYGSHFSDTAMLYNLQKCCLCGSLTAAGQDRAGQGRGAGQAELERSAHHRPNIKLRLNLALHWHGVSLFLCVICFS